VTNDGFSSLKDREMWPNNGFSSLKGREICQKGRNRRA